MTLLVFIAGFLIYDWSEQQGWVEAFMGAPGNLRRQRFVTYAKGVEILAVLLAVVAFIHEYWVEKDRDRATRNAQLLAQIAALSYDEDRKIMTTSSAIKNIMKLLAEEQVSMQGISVPGAILSDAQLAGSILPFANLEDSIFYHANLKGANLIGAFLKGSNLEGANLEGASLEGVNMIGAYLKNAKLKGARKLSQSMLNKAQPSAPPASLPKYLKWPFEPDRNGKWVRKEQSLAPETGS